MDHMTLEESLWQDPKLPCPPTILRKLVLTNVPYFNPEGRIRIGQVLHDRVLTPDIVRVFEIAFEERFPFTSIIPISHKRFRGNDTLSMEANNTSAFNYRFIDGTKKLSFHAFGKAIDFNPLLNPLKQGDIVKPEGAFYDPSRPGTLTTDCRIVRFLKERGWKWGGDCWTTLKDYQHFQIEI